MSFWEVPLIYSLYVKCHVVQLCDFKVANPTWFTYQSESNSCKLFVDHFFVDGPCLIKFSRQR